MKKISVVFALLMMMGFTQVATSATLTWGAMPGASHVTLDNNQTISAAYGFGVFKGGFSHAYNFSSVNPSHVVAYAIELLNENIWEPRKTTQSEIIGISNRNKVPK